MTFLFYIAAPLLVLAIAVAVYSLTSAPEGYEDDAGFHSLDFCRRRLARSRLTSRSSRTTLHRSGSADEDSSVPPGLPAH
jgi:hypothetical protein